MNKIVTRFAPSPTGQFHLGGVRTALYNYLFARQNAGTYILRSEDTDKARSKKEYEDSFLELFKWLSLEHDAFYRQSERGEMYKKYIEKLIADGFAYISHEEPAEEGQRSEVIRFKNPNKTITFSDIILGDIAVDTTDLKDFVIARSIEEPLYHLTVVVDDHEMGVTHIIRGQEHISNTPRQILIQEAIGAKRPLYAHLPLILGKDKSKLSKRDPQVIPAIEYRDLGYLPESILNFMALIGWNPGGEDEIFSLPDLVSRFDLTKVQKGGGVFNPEKLNWLNKEHMKLLPKSKVREEISERLSKSKFSDSPRLQDENFMQKISEIIFDRISSWGEIDEIIGAGEFDYLFEEPNYEPGLLFPKDEKDKTELNKHLSWILDKLAHSEFNSADDIKNIVFDYATANGRGKVLWPLRVALSGREKSIDPFTLIYLLGKDDSLKRINNAIAKLS